MKIIPTLQELCSLVGQEISVSDWLLIEQERIDQFAQATGDHQWIHTDPVKAANGPFKTTIAHGFLTLTDTAITSYQVTEHHSPEHEHCMAWNDPVLNIEWPLRRAGVAKPTLSPKDEQGVAFTSLG